VQATSVSRFIFQCVLYDLSSWKTVDVVVSRKVACYVTTIKSYIASQNDTKFRFSRPYLVRTERSGLCYSVESVVSLSVVQNVLWLNGAS